MALFNGGLERVRQAGTMPAPGIRKIHGGLAAIVIDQTCNTRVTKVDAKDVIPAFLY